MGAPHVPLAIAQRGHSIWSGKPQHAGGFADRGNRVRRQAITYGVIREVPVLKSAQAAAERSGPHRAVAGPVYGVHSVLRQPVGFGISLSTDYRRRLLASQQPGQPAVLPSHPDLSVRTLGDGINHVLVEP